MKTNHSEMAIILRQKLEDMVPKLNELRSDWIRSCKTKGDVIGKESGYDEYMAVKDEYESMERELNFHEIMMQEHKFATHWLWSDAHAYEIIEEKTDKMITVRRLKATLKPEAEEKLQDSFVPGGFFGHFNNGCQEWEFESDESQPIETIRKHKNGRWYGVNKAHFTIEAEPYEFYDYNF